MRHLFQSWPEFVKDYRAAEHRLFLADYDGTLAAIVGRPEDARITAGAREKLKALAEQPRTTVGVISGRSIDEVRSMVGVAGIYYSGNHGLEIEGPGLSYIHPQARAARPLMKELAARLGESLGGIEGTIVQDKDLSLSVHYRLSRPEYDDAVAGIVRRLTAPHVAKGEIKVFPMKKIWEIRPPLDWDKGKAVELIGHEIKSQFKLSRLLTVFLGDDATDEDAFKVMHRPVGWGIYVGGENQKSAAGYFLDSPQEVEDLLGRLNDLKER
jgi:trehalose 6-phosphate phosphatase